jgi:hypothetical protein
MSRFCISFILPVITLLASVLSASAVPGGQSAPISDASALTITGTGSNVPRTLAARAADEINALDFTTFQGAVTQATSAGKVLRLPPGAYSYTSGPVLTISVPVIFESGAVLTCSGANVAFTSTVTAPRNQIFTSGCTPSFWNNTRQTAVFPEWWGAAGDDGAQASATGTDNTTPLQNALNSGASQMALAPNGFYRYSSLTCGSKVSIVGANRYTSMLVQDDPTGLLDGIRCGTAGQITIQNVGLPRAQNAIGSVAAAYPVAGGSGYVVGDTLTLSGGTFTTAAVLTVTSVSSGAITGLSVQTPGAYTKAAPPTLTPTVQPAVAVAGGSGTGASVKLVWTGPAMIHLVDCYFVWVKDDLVTSGPSGKFWDGVKIEGAATNPNQIWVENSQIFNAEHDNVFLYAPNSGAPVSDIFVGPDNYIQGAVNAGVETWGYTGGAYFTANVIFNNNYAFYIDGNGYGTSHKIRHNDIDGNLSGIYAFGLSVSHFEQNWNSAGGAFVCTNCSNLHADGDNYLVNGTTSLVGSGSALIFNGGFNMNVPSSTFVAGSAPVLIGPYGGTQTQYVNISGVWHGGGGHFITSSGSSTGVTLAVQEDANEDLVSGATISNLQVFGSPQYGNQANNQPTGQILWGSGNTNTGTNSATGGANNAQGGYGAASFGYAHTSSGFFTNLRGDLASDDGLYGGDCSASGSTTGSAGAQQICQHVLRARSTSTSAIRLTSDGGAAGGANCLNLPDSSHAQFMVMVSGFNPTAATSADWQSSGPNILTRGSGASSVTYSGSFSATTAPAVSTGTGSSARLQLSADTTNGCLNVTITPPDANTWDWEAAVIRLKMR